MTVIFYVDGTIICYGLIMAIASWYSVERTVFVSAVEEICVVHIHDQDVYISVFVKTTRTEAVVDEWDTSRVTSA